MAGIPFIITVIITLILLLYSKKNSEYVEEVKGLSKQQYPFKDIMIIGLLITDKIGVDKLREKSQALYQKMLAIYGLEVAANFRLHIANKFVLSILAINAIYFVVLANGSLSLFMILVGPVAAVVTYFLADSLQEEQFKKRTKQIKYDFPEFLTKLVLLLNAGLTLERAWGKILEDTSKEQLGSPLFLEMEKTYKDLKNSNNKTESLNKLSRRCKVQEISKFTSIVLQNMSKGSSDMVFMLKQLSDECWLERKLSAKQKGEEASSKLLFPMMLMLVTVLAIVLVPAMMQMLSAI
ncbi:MULTISPECIES: type II secretion system F family protein [unclassified Clostridium]|uniref:type II secretion system F family protein n=1 Tax=unclassified Clostridium TaxID=2614128 RepID=UPI00280AC1A2|nr:type II secretion system F family protein [Clostridium sp.]MCI6693204.1 type II secretion system F family protein [Clostridium sp.]MDY4251712.1 type II secretion system F family protein [Clostridium sp.]MDY6229113.1 type II secretion system F family protein [Clostridium sp.]